MISSSKYKKNNDFFTRNSESIRISSKYPDRIPIICEKSSNSFNMPDIDKNKFLVPADFTIGQFIYSLRKRIVLRPEQAIFLFVNNILPPTSMLISDIFQKHKSDDGFLYVIYSGENTFGN